MNKVLGVFPISMVRGGNGLNQPGLNQRPNQNSTVVLITDSDCSNKGVTITCDPSNRVWTGTLGQMQSVFSYYYTGQISLDAQKINNNGPDSDDNLDGDTEEMSVTVGTAPANQLPVNQGPPPT